MKKEIKTISLNDSDYPSLLKEIPNPPLKINILGKLPEKQKTKIAVVGTRKATSEGKTIAKKIAQKLTEFDIVVVSGLAMGIDTAAHEGALFGGGQTIAVLACGLDTIYPAQNENLAKKILEADGAIISEYPADTPAYQSQFLERNRIISGLCAATIIIEAPERSGSLATANWACQQGREVFVAPGPINHPNYKGSHKLIRDGARLIGSVEDVLEDLNIKIQISKFKSQNNNSKFKIADTNQLLIYKTLQGAGQPLNIDKIIELTKLEPQVINQSLALLIIQEIIKETEKGYTI
jgi:DNA processing protein